jgi:ribosome-associated toxin RatA of RatAB toxin-antitoxin module
MMRISRSALLPYPATAMFDLVNDIEAYPRFLQGCLGARVHEASDTEITASLELGKAGLRYTLTTRNELEPPRRMRMHLVNGPFRSFDAEWNFEPLGEAACKARLDMNFEFSAGLLDAALASLFESTARELVNAVCTRAEQLYGKA